MCKICTGEVSDEDTILTLYGCSETLSTTKRVGFDLLLGCALGYLCARKPTLATISVLFTSTMLFSDLFYKVCTSPSVTRIPDLVNLQELNCSGCKNLVEIPETLVNLSVLDCTGCVKLKKIPYLPSLTLLICSKCPISEIPPLPNLMRLCCKFCPIAEIPKLPELVKINCGRCPNLVKLGTSLDLPKLTHIRCHYSSRLSVIPTNNYEEIETEGCPWLFPTAEQLKRLRVVQTICKNYLNRRKLCIKNQTCLSVQIWDIIVTY